MARLSCTAESCHSVQRPLLDLFYTDCVPLIRSSMAATTLCGSMRFSRRLIKRSHTRSKADSRLVKTWTSLVGNTAGVPSKNAKMRRRCKRLGSWPFFHRWIVAIETLSASAKASLVIPNQVRIASVSNCLWSNMLHTSIKVCFRDLSAKLQERIILEKNLTNVNSFTYYVMKQ